MPQYPGAPIVLYVSTKNLISNFFLLQKGLFRTVLAYLAYLAYLKITACNSFKMTNYHWKLMPQYPGVH
jgi:hypothetical protein